MISCVFRGKHPRSCLQIREICFLEIVKLFLDYIWVKVTATGDLSETWATGWSDTCLNDNHATHADRTAKIRWFWFETSAARVGEASLSPETSSPWESRYRRRAGTIFRCHVAETHKRVDCNVRCEARGLYSCSHDFSFDF